MPRFRYPSKFLYRLERDINEIASAPPSPPRTRRSDVVEDEALYPAKSDAPRRRRVEDPETMGPKAASIAAALRGFEEKDFADPAKRESYRRLRSQQELIRRSQQKVPASGADRRQFSPVKDFARNLYGEFARVSLGTGTKGDMKFSTPWSVIPCIQRMVRREVMFAKRKAGVGHKGKHRRNSFTGIPC